MELEVRVVEVAGEVEISKIYHQSFGEISILVVLKIRVAVDHAGHLAPQPQLKVHWLGRGNSHLVVHLRISHFQTR